MYPNLNIDDFLDALKENKAMVLFLGSGTDFTDIYPETYSHLKTNDNTHLLNWHNLLNELEKYACVSEEDQKAISQIESNSMKAAVLKSILGGGYIPVIQNWLYSRCNYEILEASYPKFKQYKDNPTEETLASVPFATLFVLADLILRQTSIRCVVTQNYNNFLSDVIKILLKNSDKELYGYRKNLEPVDVYDGWRDESFTEETFLIYHVHGYIPPYHEIQPRPESNHIVLSDEEFYQLSRDVYSWQNTSQIYFLTHYTCVFIGLSMEDLTSLRLIRHAQLDRSSEKVYWLRGSDGLKLEADINTIKFRLIVEYFTSQNISVVNGRNYNYLYNEIFLTLNQKENQYNG